ncbi:zinc finger CCCH domain-containing protein 11A [Boleophthalmus pectinirostris]|uniref:zinc finger CCCH domain-containing protein 11A n=1 Tax=Boleophthalmus pectinirostris TaxID=150288 RepID=UPI00243214AF|nr:zinc finger CCCH domain-containing protein 11A [Boleophthalmus pectinirostris]XP_020786562.2 zinc finger CCCH domain-containing protein 11A [Boleophthalmus pectinirostris]
MTNHGDDCYFFYYSTCTKGDACPFRHCEAAIGNEVVCNLWEEGRCFRPVCKFRHMKITHNRKEIACYWENQPAGCQKPHCAFFHEKPRCIDGLFVPADKGLKKSEEVPPEEPVPSQPTLPTAANPQVRGVKKSETQEPVPSPTHPPVVINPADDDEDEDDQFSEEGEVGVSPRKQPGGPKSDGSLNFGVSTLEEIRLRRALKASMKRAIYPGGDTSASGGKENSFMQTRDAVDFRCGVPLRRSLAERLGKVMDEEEPPVPQKSSKPVKQRLTLPSDLIAETPVETRSKKPEQIRIKTLEEIKLEKAAKSQNPKEGSVSEIAITKTIITKNPKGLKRAITVKDNSIGNIQTFSEMVHAKKKRQEENLKQDKHPSEKGKDKSQDKAEAVRSQAKEVKESGGEIRVKTLEEIRREKAARLQAQEEVQQVTTDPQESSAKKPRLLRLRKAASQSKDIPQKSEDVTQKPEKPPKSTPNPPESSSNGIKVKTFEEIMREKRLRKNDTEEPASSSSQTKNTTEQQSSDSVVKREGPAVKREDPAKIMFTPDSSTTNDSGVPQTKTSPAKVSAPVKNNGTVSKESASKNITPERQTQEKGADTKGKVRPKLNVKPSVVKPSVHLKPGQKRKAPERSAVAAVKPLNSTSNKPKSEAVCADSQMFSSTSSDNAQSSEFLYNAVTSSDSSCKPTPVSQVQEALVPDDSTVNQSRTLKSPQPKSRRTSGCEPQWLQQHCPDINSGRL